ncbi:MAG: response regulator transcription factor, partial [Loktanella sp.]|nr:response regulator transcription factor [Loktanella sp.]
MALKILVVDDEADIRDLIKTCLMADDHMITTASSFQEAKIVVGKGQFDLFILDLSLGDGSGLDLVQKIRAEQQGWIIILSGRTDPVDRVVGLEIGADDYISKPFHVRELRSRVSAAERRMKTMQPDPKSNKSAGEGFSGLRIDAIKRRVETADGTTVNLSAQEFAVLQYLLSHPEKPHNREVILTEAL